MIFLEILFSSTLQLACLVGAIMSIGLILGVMEMHSNRYMQMAFGRNSIMVTALVGTPVHELGHAAMGLLFGHRINSVKLLQIPDKNGVLGYVNHSYNSKNLYQKVGLFFIGLAPIFSGTAAILGLMAILIPDAFSAFMENLSTGQLGYESLETNLNLFKVLLGSIFTLDNLKTPVFWIFLYLSVSIASHIALSKSDIVQCRDGLFVIFICLIFLNIAGIVLNIDTSGALNIVSNINAYIISFSLLSILFSGFGLAFSYISFKIKSLVL